MRSFGYEIKLFADAEPGTGLGGETINDLIPRDPDGLPMLRATHVKGLMRVALRDIVALRPEWSEFLPDKANLSDQLINRVFGQEGQTSASQTSLLRISDALITDSAARRATARNPARTVSRTALEDNRTARNTSLRTTEQAARDTVFSGTIWSGFDASTVEDIAWRLALQSICSVGGSRSRTGQALVTLKTLPAEATLPGSQLKQLDEAIRQRRFHQRSKPTDTNEGQTQSSQSPLDTAVSMLELLFVADSPVCCPEQPDRTNVIVSGFSIPASTVQGVILHRLNDHNPQLASQLFESPGFRCWPLQPCGLPQDEGTRDVLTRSTEHWFDELPCSIRVSLSHRAARFSTTGYDHRYFFDSAFDQSEPTNPDNAPLSSCDGVILYGTGTRRLANEAVEADRRLLWKAAAMPRVLTAHGVLDGPKTRANSAASGRNLFTADAMAPLIWRGRIALPARFAQIVLQDLQKTPDVAIGKARTVRGFGRLYARQIDAAQFCGSSGGGDARVLVLQSPALCPDGLYQELVNGTKSAEQVLQDMAGVWLDRHGLPQLSPTVNAWVNAGIRFGWNRTVGQQNGGVGFQNAVPVLLPGTVFKLSSDPPADRLQAAILAGFHAAPENATDPGRTRGFGAIAIHPGTAVGAYEPHRPRPEKQPSALRDAIQKVYELRKVPRLPSPAQIRAVEQLILPGTNQDETVRKARQYLDSQRERHPRIWHDWEDVFDTVSNLLGHYSPVAAKAALKMLADIAVTRTRES